MQLKKDKLYAELLKVAKEEFIRHGYNDANMRTIAKKSGVGLSNIYNYFRDKDAIFREVLQPLINDLERLMGEHNKDENLDINIFTSKEYLAKHTKVFVDLILQFKDELKLLFYRSHGSSLENYKEYYINKHTKLGVEYMRLMKEKYPEINTEISNFFIHTKSSWWISIIGELSTHNLSKKMLERFISEYMEFATAGWKKIMKVK